MFCNSQLLLLQVVCAAQISLSPVHSQPFLGLILEAPQAAVVPLGSSASFTCRAVGNVFWEVNTQQIQSQRDIDRFAGINISVPLSTPDASTINVTIATDDNNGTSFECLVERAGSIDILNMTEIVTLTVYGEPSPPTDLVLTRPPQGLGVSLTWMAGLAIQGEEVTFVIVSEEVASGITTESGVNIPSATLQPTFSVPTCQTFNFTVYSQNGFSRSSTGISGDILLPAVPLPLESDDLTVNVSLQGPAATISFPDLSPCEEFRVRTYILMFSEVANSMGVDLSSPFNISHVSNVSLLVTAADSLLLGREYDVTLFAVNSVGSSSLAFHLSTVGLLSSEVVVTEYTFATVTCVFAVESTALGCQATFDPSLVVEVIRNQGATVATQDVSLPADLSRPVMVTVAEILSDASVGSITIQPMVTVLVSTTTAMPLPDFTTITTSSTRETSTSISTQLPVSTENGSILSGNTLFIIVGVIVGVILVLLLIIIIVVCVLRSNHRRKHVRRLALTSSEELKPNYVYGERESLPHLTATTELGGGRQARSNTYDNPALEATAGNGGAVPIPPMYETIQAAKKEMLAVAGPVLNPVYGPTAATPTSPHPPPSKAAPNPVYSETGATPLPDVSGLNPVYAAVGKPATPAQPSLSDPPPPRYAYAYTSVTATNGKASSNLTPSLKRADSAGYPPPVPMYEELQSTKRSDSVGVASKEIMTKNESYGLLGTMETCNSPPPLTEVAIPNGN